MSERSMKVYVCDFTCALTSDCVGYGLFQVRTVSKTSVHCETVSTLEEVVIDTLNVIHHHMHLQQELVGVQFESLADCPDHSREKDNAYQVSGLFTHEVI